MTPHRTRAVLVAAAFLLVVAACGDDPGGPGDVGGGGDGTGGSGGSGGSGEGGTGGIVAVDLIADVNRDGVVAPGNADDDEGEDGWNESRGAIFLPNLDDDDEDGRPDANDAKVNGAADILDLTPILVAPFPVPEGGRGVVRMDEASWDWARLFLAEGPADDPASYRAVGAGTILDAATLASGATFLLEGRSPKRSTAEEEWSGFVDLVLEVQGPDGAILGTDAVRLRVAPLLFQFNTAPTRAVYYTDSGDWSEPLVTGLKAALAQRDLDPLGLDTPGGPDPWTQDFFDVAYVSKPGEGGAPFGMWVAIRSAQPDRSAGAIVNRHFLGPDFGSFYIHEAGGTDPYTHGYSMNSFGNWDVIPPHATAAETYPLGRNVFGAGTTPDERPDPVFVDFVHAQAVQPPLEMDTTWLAVGHVDEYVQWVADPGPKGFRTLVAHPAGARDLLLELREAGHGAVPMFVGKYFYDFDTGQEYPAEVTVAEVLADADRMAASEYAQTVIDEEIDKLAAATDLGEEDITPMPFLFEEIWGTMLAYQPGTVNLLHVDGVVVIADPFGPVIDGVDPFKADLETRLGAHGLEVYFADDWDLYHAMMGEVHCGTNVVREMDLRWWESGR
jgi:protein-arginine deiminase